MGVIHVQEFTGGLDARRMPEATSGGVLVKANDCHVTRGGELEQRAAFVPEFTLVAGTVGMFYDTAGIVVFGSDAEPNGLPSGVSYQRLQHADTATALTRVLCADLYAGKIYVVGEFADGALFHFYDGARVTDWFDGRARATFQVTGGGVGIAVPAAGSFDVTGGSATTPAVPATGGFTVTGGSAGAGNELAALTVDGVDVLGAAVAHTGDDATTAAGIADQINLHSSSPDYTASALGAVVTIEAAVAGAGPNGLVVAATPGGDVTVGSVNNMAGGADAIVNRFLTVTVAGVDVLGAPVTHTGDNAAMATAIAGQINSYTSSPDYTAAAVGTTVVLTAVIPGVLANGRVVSATVTGDAAFGNTVAFSGGADVATSVVNDIKVNGVSTIAAPVSWAVSNEATATALATAINGFTSSPDYTATVVGAFVSITASDPGSAPNGYAVNFSLAGGFAVSPIPLALGNGADSTSFQPGAFVKTVGQKMHSVSGPLYHFSGIKEPTQWTTDAVGAGFIDLSVESSGAEELKAIARYMTFVAVFAERTVQIWYSDPDPVLNRQVQVLNNTGTASPLSVTPFGDTDIFYLDESGLRSLRARDSSNAAATTDIGVPVDDLITEKLETLNEFERQRVTGLIEPRNGRFWLIMKDKIFVFSFFNGAKVSAWSTYSTTYEDDGQTVGFDVDAAMVFRRRVYLRSGDTIFVYGGLATGSAHDNTEAEIWLPYLDANDPTRKKQLRGIDLAMRGLWEVSAAMDPVRTNAEDKIGVFDETTYNLDGSMPFFHHATHVSLRFRSRGAGPHRLGACVIHYDGHNDED